MYLKCKYKYTITLISVDQQSICGTHHNLDKILSYLFQRLFMRKTSQSLEAEAFIPV